MSKVRVHEYAKKVNKTSKEVIEVLAKHNLPVKNHMAVIDEQAVSKLNSVFKQAVEPTKDSPAKTSAKAVNVTPKRGEQGQNKVQQGQKQDRPQSASNNQQPNKASNAQGQTKSQQGEKIRNDKGNQNRNMTQNNFNNRKGGTTQNTTSNNKGGNTPNKGGNTPNRGGNTPNKGGNTQNKGGYQQRRKPGINGGKRRTHRPAPQPMVQKNYRKKLLSMKVYQLQNLQKNYTVSHRKLLKNYSCLA